MTKTIGTVTTLDLHEAAEFLGFKSKEALRRKIKQGIVPGFKIGKEWRCVLEDLYTCIKNKSTKECLSQRKKIALITIPDSQLMESECKSLRDALREKKQNGMRN